MDIRSSRASADRHCRLPSAVSAAAGKLKRWLAALLFLPSLLQAQGELRFCLRSDPHTFHPLLADDTSTATLLYLTSAVLIRLDRLTQQATPELADSWNISSGGKVITFHLRPGVAFSDGTPFTAADVAFTIQAVTDTKLHSPIGESFAGAVRATVLAPDSVSVAFPAPQANFPALFDTLPMLSARSPLKEKATAGPFLVSSYQPGSEILLKPNPHYWKRGGKKDAAGGKLPRLDSIRIQIQQNREIEYTRFRRGELQLMNRVDPALFERLLHESPREARNAGPSTDVEFFWLNQAPSANLPPFKRAWFQSRVFRQALSQAINRADICRIVFLGFAQPALGPVSAANLFWFDKTLKPQAYDPSGSLDLLRREGFTLAAQQLRDKSGNPVEFSIVTSGKPRERTAVLMQQDLKALGIKLNIVPLEMNSFVERIRKTLQYEAALLGFSNLDLDPNGQMNVWPSSSGDHAWNPHQSSPETPWEAEIDKLMLAQSANPVAAQRKPLFDRLQQIVRQQLPYIYLVNKNSLSAIALSLKGATPAPLFPEALWNIDQMYVQ